MAYDNLQIDEDMSFQEKNWKVERVGWLFMALILLASAVGVMEKGPIGRTRRGDPQRLLVEYQRFLHVDAPARLRIRLPAAGPFVVQVPFEYLSKTEVSHIIPEPESVASYDGLVTYSFLARQGIADIQFDLKPRQAGSLKGFVQSGSERIDFSHFVYP